MTVVPGATPVTIPVAEPTVATAVLPLNHVPPPVGSNKDVVLPTQTVGIPMMAVGGGVTVTVMVAAQPVLNV